MCSHRQFFVNKIVSLQSYLLLTFNKDFKIYNFFRMKKHILFHIITALLLCSCGSIKDYNYFQDTSAGDIMKITNATQSITVKPHDKISILIACKDPHLGAMFNPMVSSTRLDQTNLNGSINGSYMSHYIVDGDGNVDIPVLGKINVGGLTRSQIAEKVKHELTTSEQGVKDATVTVEFINLHIGVLGEVRSPGFISIDRDQLTIVDALVRAGDLTQYGNRKSIKVYRKTDEGLETYQVDITNFSELCASPVYMMQQDDIIYVEPTKIKARQSTTTGNTLLTPTFWVSALSLIVSVITFAKY